MAKKWLKGLSVDEHVNGGTGFISFECPSPTDILIRLIPPQGKLLFIGVEPDKNRPKIIKEEFHVNKFFYKEFSCKSPPWLKGVESVWGFILTVNYDKVEDYENIEFLDYAPYGGYWFIFDDNVEIDSELLIDTLNSKEGMLRLSPCAGQKHHQVKVELSARVNG